MGVGGNALRERNLLEATEIGGGLILVFGKQVKEKMRELTGGWLEEFSELWSQECSYQS